MFSRLAHKVQSNAGASILIALMFALICGAVSAIVLSSANANAEHSASQGNDQQAFITAANGIEFAESLVTDQALNSIGNLVLFQRAPQTIVDKTVSFSLEALSGAGTHICGGDELADGKTVGEYADTNDALGIKKWVYDAVSAYESGGTPAATTYSVSLTGKDKLAKIPATTLLFSIKTDSSDSGVTYPITVTAKSGAMGGDAVALEKTFECARINSTGVGTTIRWDGATDAIEREEKVKVRFEATTLGTIDGASQKEVLVDAGTVLSASDFPTVTAKDEGDTFKEWTLNGSAVDLTAGYRVTEPVTFVASWNTDTVTVAFDVSGGSFADGFAGSYTVKKGKSLRESNVTSLSVPTKQYVSFEGWKLNGEGEIVKNADVLDMKFETNATLIAQWSEKIVTVTWNPTNDGSFAEANQSYTTSKLAGESIGLSDAPALTPRENLTFIGWYEGEEGNGAKLAAGYVLTGDVTFTARWSAQSETVTVRFGPAGGKWPDGSTDDRVDTVESGTILTAGPDTVTRDGYTFRGWASAANNGTFIENCGAIDRDTVFYAIWDPNKYTIKFDLNGGSLQDTTGYTLVEGSTYSKEIAMDTKFDSVPEVNEREGYTFAGWFTGDTPMEGYVVKGPVTFTAKWEEKPAEQTTDGNGQTTEPNTDTSQSGDESSGI